jgi:hypothetical protein
MIYQHVYFDQKEQKHDVHYVTDLSPNDVLLGRGAFSINYVGNVIFREMCKDRKEEYKAALKRTEKNSIAKQIVYEVRARKGRFLRLLNCEELIDFPANRGTKTWAVVNSCMVLDKVKQSLRDKDYQRPRIKSSLNTQTNQVSVTSNGADTDINSRQRMNDSFPLALRVCGAFMEVSKT